MKKHFLSQTLVALLPVAYFLMIVKSLPAEIPMHYNIHGKPDRMGSPLEMGLVIAFMAIITIGVSAVLLNIEKLDPKNKLSGNQSLMIKMAWATTIFVTALSGYITHESLSFTANATSQFSGKGLLLIIAAFFSVLGNFMNNIKPNHFVGVRTPWTLENEDNWRKTHHLTSKLWFFSGIAMAGLVLILSETTGMIIFIAMILLISIIPILYSYRLYKQMKRSGI